MSRTQTEDDMHSRSGIYRYLNDTRVQEAVLTARSQLNEMFIEAVNSAVAVSHVNMTHILEQHTKFYPVLQKLFFDSAIRATLVSIGVSSDVRDEFLIPEHGVTLFGLSKDLSLWERKQLLCLDADSGYHLNYHKWGVMIKLLNRAIEIKRDNSAPRLERCPGLGS
ncbi:uncharacterized protein KD926_001177 [Aspergillus affinis]|uniref:uncharacterized protein n=1 Tax=Aspergillus affinis TaxID=1070780 RepID=UPI0022FF387C|nr:uncharacterized protein KD926_001177 [Aspergillus affinis]KAI9036933.1 hypothetical protein KD926_001177 [Aspergillus affinis]